MIASVDTTRALLTRYNINPKQRFGQNFMVVDKTPKTIANHPSISDRTLVIEIGPGLGALTEVLAQKAKHVLCIEIDTQLANLLKSEFESYGNVEILNMDFLKFNLSSINYKNYDNVVVVSNLPYYITSDILNKLILDEHDFYIIAMMQKEVAERILKCSDFNNLVLISNLFTSVSKLCDVSKNDYFPKPNVDSTVLTFKKLDIREKASYYNLIEYLFKQKRKTIYNNLNEMAKPYKISEKFVSNLLLEAEIDVFQRIDQVNVYKIKKLLELLHTKINFSCNAKVNLGLSVVGKTSERHDLESLFVPISLYDDVQIIRTQSKLIEYNSNKIFDFNIFKSIYDKHFNESEFGYLININKKIPISAGLGGGSSDLYCFSQAFLTDNHIENDNLKKSLLESSSDSLFFELNKPALLKGLDNYKQVNIDYLKDFNMLIVVPDIEISTKSCFEKFDQLNPKINPFHVDFTTLNSLKQSIHNDLEESAFALEPSLKQFKEKLEEFNPEILTMSGSGPAYVVLDKDINKLENIISNMKNECRFCEIVHILFNN